MPEEAEAQTVLVQRPHAAGHCSLVQLLGSATLEQAACLRSDEQRLEHRDPAAIPAGAGTAAGGTIERHRAAHGEVGLAGPRLEQLLDVHVVRLAATGAELAGEPLRDEAVRRGGQKLAADTHLGEPGDGAADVFGLHRSEQELSGHGSVEGRPCCLRVGEVTDEHDVGIGSENRAQALREAEPALAIDLDLADARQRNGDGILDRHQATAARVELTKSCVERGRGAAFTGPGHDDGAVRAGDGALQLLGGIRRQPELLERQLPRRPREAQDDSAAVGGRRDRHARVDLVGVERERDLLFLRAPADDVQSPDPLEPIEEGFREGSRSREELLHDPVHAGANDEPVRLGLEMEI